MAQLAQQRMNYELHQLHHELTHNCTHICKPRISPYRHIHSNVSGNYRTQTMKIREFINLLTILLTFIVLTSCKQTNVDGVIIGSTLLENQDYSTNKRLCNIIKRTIGKDQQALIELTEFWCGGAAGCYDLGYVLTQIINKIGEQEFIKLTNGLTQKQKNEISGLIAVGLEFGDNDYDGNMDNTTIDKTFHDLQKELKE